MTSKSKVIIVAISILVAALHFIIGPDYSGPMKIFVRGYLIDILLPMNLFLLVQLAFRGKLTLLRSRFLAFISIFLFGSIVEILQYYSIPFLGSTFDPYDFIMYGSGLVLGLIIDIAIIGKIERTNETG